jgi:hypothetical protein
VTAIAVVKINPLFDRRDRLVARRPRAPVDQLAFEGCEEALDDGVDAPMFVKPPFLVSWWTYFPALERLGS